MVSGRGFHIGTEAPASPCASLLTALCALKCSRGLTLREARSRHWEGTDTQDIALQDRLLKRCEATRFVVSIEVPAREGELLHIPPLALLHRARPEMLQGQHEGHSQATLPQLTSWLGILCDLQTLWAVGG